MIPDFNGQGYLPPGVHGASLDEIAERFGQESELGRVQMESLRWLVDLARRAGVLRIVVNGSFATDAWEPHDVDCALLIGPDYPRDATADREIQEGLPFIQAELVTYERSWVRNVVAIGNAAGFVEPLESSALAIICDESRLLPESLYISGRAPSPSLMATYNQINARAWDTIRDFLALHYRFNTRLDTPFWRACCGEVELAGSQQLVDYYLENGPNTFGRTTLIHGNGFCGMEGYLVMLVGQKVPYRQKYVPSAEEWRIWHNVRMEHRMQALNALSVREALDAIASPGCQWVPGFFRSPTMLTPNASRLTPFHVTD